MSIFTVKTSVFTLLIAYTFQSLVLAVPFSYNSSLSTLNPRSCENTATSRSCWGDYDINTDYYSVIPQTGVTRGISLSTFPQADGQLLMTSIRVLVIH